MSWNVGLPNTLFFIGPTGNRYQQKDQNIIHQPNSEVFHQIVREVCDQPFLAMDTETTGLVSWKDIPLYWSLSWGNKRITLRSDTTQYFTQAFTNPHITWIFASAKYDMHIMANWGIGLA